MHLNAVIIENTIYLLLKGCVSSLVLQNLPVFSLGLNILKALNRHSLSAPQLVVLGHLPFPILSEGGNS